MKVHYKIKLLTAALVVLLTSHNTEAAGNINATEFIKGIPGLAGAARPGIESSYTAEGLGNGAMWQQWKPSFDGKILPSSDFVQAVIALRQPGTRAKTDFSRDIFAHVTIAILNQRDVTDVSLGMHTSNMGRHVRSIQLAIEWNNTDMQTVMEKLGYTGMVHLPDGIDFKDEVSNERAVAQSVQNAAHKAGKDVKKVAQNVVARPAQKVKRLTKKAFGW